jgi:hypothetical protein
MIEVYKNKYIAKKAYIKEKGQIGNFLLIGITSSDAILFTEYINGQIIEQIGFNVSWFKEKGAKINNLEIDEFKRHDCFDTYNKYLKIFGEYEFQDEMIEVPFVGIVFKVEDEYKSLYLDSSIGAILRFSSETLEVERISKTSEFFFLNFYKIRDKLIKLLFDQYTYFKEEVLDWELDEEEELEYPDILATEEVRKLVEFKSIHFYERENGIMIQLDGDCSWDPEHGFTFRINENLEIEEVHL